MVEYEVKEHNGKWLVLENGDIKCQCDERSDACEIMEALDLLNNN